jgi:hypothetical protein
MGRLFINNHRGKTGNNKIAADLRPPLRSATEVASIVIAVTLAKNPGLTSKSSTGRNILTNR